MGYVEGGADTVIDALLEVVGKEGTIVMPTYSTGEAGEFYDAYDPQSTPVWTGRIPEVFRQREGAVRSLHPVHSITAIGPKAVELTQGHERLIAPCGKDNPYYRLAEFGGYILLLGVRQSSNSIFHVAEEIRAPSYLDEKIRFSKLLLKDYYRLPPQSKKEVIKAFSSGPERDFNKMDRLLKEGGAMKIGNIGEAIVRLIIAKGLIDITLRALERDPRALLKDKLEA